MKRAFGYCRVSSTGQYAEDRDGIPRQKEAIRKYAAANGIRIVRWFEDSVSGKKDLDNRPALQELMTALHANGVRLVLIEKLDRLARDLMIQESIIADLQRGEFELTSTAEPDLCSTDPTRVLLRQMMGAFAQYERTMIVQKLRGARQRIRAREGRCEGRKPYGERPGEQAVIDRALKLSARGLNYTHIADKLNAEGVSTRTGSRWFPATVSRMLARATAS